MTNRFPVQEKFVEYVSYNPSMSQRDSCLGVVFDFDPNQPVGLSRVITCSIINCHQLRVRSSVFRISALPLHPTLKKGKNRIFLRLIFERDGFDSKTIKQANFDS
jgi:hypothetical protein